MYFVNDKPFDELLDAVQHCKTTPMSILKDSQGVVLMEYQTINKLTFLEIELAKRVLERQLKNIREMN